MGVRWSHAKPVELKVKEIQEDPAQPRAQIWAGDSEDQKLLYSIKTHGMINGIYIYWLDGVPTILDGHRRFRAAKLLEFDTVSCLDMGELPKADRELIRFNLNRGW